MPLSGVWPSFGVTYSARRSKVCRFHNKRWATVEDPLIEKARNDLENRGFSGLLRNIPFVNLHPNLSDL